MRTLGATAALNLLTLMGVALGQNDAAGDGQRWTGGRLVYQLDLDRGPHRGIAHADLEELKQRTMAAIWKRLPKGRLKIQLDRVGRDRIQIGLIGHTVAQIDEIQASLERLGTLALQFAAFQDFGGGRIPGSDIHLDEERDKLREWWAARLEEARADETVSVDLSTLWTFNRLENRDNGPRKGFYWVPLENPPNPEVQAGKVLFLKGFYKPGRGEWAERDPVTGRVSVKNVRTLNGEMIDVDLKLGPIDPIPLKMMRRTKERPYVHGEWLDVVLIRDERVHHPKRNWAFTGSDLEKVFFSYDGEGYPAIGFELKKDRARAFESYTGRFRGRHLCILVDGHLVSAPVVEEALPGSAIIRGNYTPRQIEEAIRMLRSPLPSAIKLVARDILK